MSRPIVDTVASAIGHGMCTRFPKLKLALVENGSGWVRGLFETMEYAYNMAPNAFEEHPIDVFKRNIYVHPFHEENPKGLAELVGIDHVLFGSDFPHPEGLADPIAFADEIGDLDDESIAKIMGGNLARLMNIENTPAR